MTSVNNLFGFYFGRVNVLLLDCNLFAVPKQLGHYFLSGCM